MIPETCYMSPAPLLAMFPPPPPDLAGGVADRPGSVDYVANRCGVSSRTVARWRGGQRIRFDTADRVALNLGRHPAEIWRLEW